MKAVSRVEPILTPDLKAFFEVIPDIIEPENGRFSFWNGLGATSESLEPRRYGC